MIPKMVAFIAKGLIRKVLFKASIFSIVRTPSYNQE